VSWPDTVSRWLSRSIAAELLGELGEPVVQLVHPGLDGLRLGGQVGAGGQLTMVQVGLGERPGAGLCLDRRRRGVGDEQDGGVRRDRDLHLPGQLRTLPRAGRRAEPLGYLVGDRGGAHQLRLGVEVYLVLGAAADHVGVAPDRVDQDRGGGLPHRFPGLQPAGRRADAEPDRQRDQPPPVAQRPERVDAGHRCRVGSLHRRLSPSR
jgi:hypothetical protein